MQIVVCLDGIANDGRDIMQSLCVCCIVPLELGLAVQVEWAAVDLLPDVIYFAAIAIQPSIFSCVEAYAFEIHRSCCLWPVKSGCSAHKQLAAGGG